MRPKPPSAIRINSQITSAIVELENNFLKVVIYPAKGADIHQLIYKPKNIDVLWKTPWGSSRLGHPSAGTWMDGYTGGSQVIFPNGGPACTYKGADLTFHGEASISPWECDITTHADAAEARLVTRLARSPFRMERIMRVQADRAVLSMRERITNEGDEPMDYMWGHHPAYGEPFLSGDCRIDIGARTLLADDEYDPPFNPLSLNRKYEWPNATRDGKTTDLSHVPPKSQPRALYGYFQDFESGWYGITNTKLGFGVGMTWPIDIFPCAWFWQELSASGGYPWYRAAHTMAIEPFTSHPGQGLLKVMEKTGTQRVLKPGETVQAELNFVFYQSTLGVRKINPDGSVVQREQ